MIFERLLILLFACSYIGLVTATCPKYRMYQAMVEDAQKRVNSINAEIMQLTAELGQGGLDPETRKLILENRSYHSQELVEEQTALLDAETKLRNCLTYGTD